MKSSSLVAFIFLLATLFVGCSPSGASAKSDPANGSCSYTIPDVTAAQPAQAVTSDQVSVTDVCSSPQLISETVNINHVTEQIELTRVYRIRTPFVRYVLRCYYASALPDKLSDGFSNSINAPPNKQSTAAS